VADAPAQVQRGCRVVGAGGACSLNAGFEHKRVDMRCYDRAASTSRHGGSEGHGDRPLVTIFLSTSCDSSGAWLGTSRLPLFKEQLANASVLDMQRGTSTVEVTDRGRLYIHGRPLPMHLLIGIRPRLVARC
jgi:hypothetical protein